MMKRILISQRGQTLVDVIVALALLATSVASAGILSTTSSRTSGEAGRRAQATALADRELEGLRSLRDQIEHGADDTTGWGETDPFSESACFQFDMKLDGNSWTVGDDSLTEPRAYTSTDFTPSTDVYNGFSRMIRICPTNDYVQDSTSETVSKIAPSDNVHAFTVAVTVTWQEASGTTRQVTLHSLLSDYVQ